MTVLFYAIRPCNGLDTIVSNGRKKTMFRLLLDTALKTVAYLSQVIQIVETLVRRKIRFIAIKEAIEFDGKQDLRTKVMIAAGSYVVFQHQSGRYPIDGERAVFWSEAHGRISPCNVNGTSWFPLLKSSLIWAGLGRHSPSSHPRRGTTSLRPIK